MLKTIIAATLLVAVAMGWTPVARAQAETGPPQVAPPAALSEETIRNLLVSQGYTEVTGLTRRGAEYTAKARRYGETVEIVIDARTGMVDRPEHLSPTQVKHILEDRGYADIRSIRRDGESFRARAKKDGEAIEVEIDSKAGSLKGIKRP